MRVATPTLVISMWFCVASICSRQECGAFSTVASRTRALRTPALSHRRLVQHSALPPSSSTSTSVPPPQNMGILGGGLAGLAVVYHSLQNHLYRSGDDGDRSSSSSQNSHPLQSITVWDRCPVGTGGASAVAGGLVHPLSPRGKLVHLGLECMSATRDLVEAAVRSTPTPDNKGDIVLGHEILRLATTETQRNQLLDTQDKLPQYCKWLDATELPHVVPKEHVLGALRIHQGGCLVLHVPSYLRGLWRACEMLAEQANVELIYNICGTTDNLVDAVDWEDHDVVVLAAGAGILQEPNLFAEGDRTVLPVQLVRGQSIEMNVPETLPVALLCGKYVSPLPGDGRVLVGATHEFQDDPWQSQDVASFLKDATSTFYTWPPVEENGVERITSGYRVQSQRGPHGRRPILGQLDGHPSFGHHNRAYIFTGLSSRGLLYHAYYARALVTEIFGDTGNDDKILDSDLTTDDLHWWRNASTK